MKAIFIALTLLAAIKANAQLKVGSSGVFIAGGTTFYTEGLVLTPTSDLTIGSDTIAYTATPITNTSGASINKVFSLTSPILFTGTLGIRYASADLNGNTESLLQLAIGGQATSSTIVTTTTSSDGTPGSYFVSDASISNASLGLLTATNSGVDLPVKLLGFYAKNVAAGALLTWQVGQEINFKQFVIQRSPDGGGFQAIGSVKGNGGPSYFFTDGTPGTGVNYYRLRMEDLDGKADYSKVVSLLYEAAPFSVTTSPNPVIHSVTIRRSNTTDPSATVVVTDMAGRTLMSKNMAGAALSLDLSQMPGGVYLVLFRDKDHLQTMKIYKQ